MPKTSTDFWTARAGAGDYTELVQRWGNLTLLPMPVNTSLQNLEWSYKVAGYGLTAIDLTTDLAALPDWTADDVALRARWLGALAVPVWSVVGNLGNVPTQFSDVRRKSVLAGSIFRLTRADSGCRRTRAQSSSSGPTNSIVTRDELAVLVELAEHRERAVAAEAAEEQHGLARRGSAAGSSGASMTPRSRCPPCRCSGVRQAVHRVADEERAAVHLDHAEEPALEGVLARQLSSCVRLRPAMAVSPTRPARSARPCGSRSRSGRARRPGAARFAGSSRADSGKRGQPLTWRRWMWTPSISLSARRSSSRRGLGVERRVAHAAEPDDDPAVGVDRDRRLAAARLEV